MDGIKVKVKSKSDQAGVTPTLHELAEHPGVFEGTISLTSTKHSSGDRLRVAGYDWIEVEYFDDTIPAEAGKSIDITARAKVVGEPGRYRDVR